jgi:DNA-binding CsgD family transcriptional regulator/tetratricopeptide (TPR) repeat protein
VLVTGEAGIGKTVLMRAFVETASVPTSWGMCDSLSTPRPLGPLRDVADEMGPAVVDVLRGSAAQHEIFAAVLDALRARARVLVVEDLHWADEATLDLVRFLARRIATLPLCLVVSFRDVAVDHPLRAALGDLVSAPDTRRLQLVPLSKAAVTELLDGHALDPAVVHRRTAGNPFFVSQILAQPESPLPESVRDAVLARAVALMPAQRRCLELLSCAPEGVHGELLAALHLPQEAVESLAATGLVDRRGSGLAFRHEIARSAVLGAIAPGSEAALHARMIDALETIGGDASILAHHACAVRDVPRILSYAPTAGAEAARAGAHREAVAFYELALQHAEAADVRAELLEMLSTELYLTDRLVDAIEARSEALAQRRELADDVAVGTAHRAISGFEWYAADRAAAERHDGAALDILSRTDEPKALGFALANHAFLAAQRGDTAEAQQSGGHALRIADDLDDAVLRGTAATALAVARLLDGDLDAREELLAASGVGLRHRNDDLATTPMSNLCHLDVEQGRFVEAEGILADALRISEERDTPICSMWQLGVRARLRLLQGRWPEAEQDAHAVLDTGEFPLGRLWPHLVLGLLATRRAAPPENPHLEALWSIALRLDNPSKLAPAAAALAEQAWITRRPDPRLGRRPVTGLAAQSFPGCDQVLAPLRRWLRRLRDSGVQDVETGAPDVQASVAAQPYEQALALWDDGSADALLAALPMLDDLRADAVVARVRGRLRELGILGIPRGRLPATRDNPGGLTGRQLDVLALLVDGLSNADIAARLVISRKTADHHVSAILGKLGVRSRGEAAALARRLGV